MENSQNHRFLWKIPGEALSGPRSGDRPASSKGNPPARGGTPLTGQPRGALAYSPMSWSCAGAMRGGDGDSTSPPVTVA